MKTPFINKRYLRICLKYSVNKAELLAKKIWFLTCFRGTYIRKIIDFQTAKSRINWIKKKQYSFFYKQDWCQHFFETKKTLISRPMYNEFFSFFHDQMLYWEPILKKTQVLSKSEIFIQIGALQSFFYFCADFCILCIKTANLWIKMTFFV